MMIQELGSLGEFVAAIATLATLIYLALQIRRNTAATRAMSYQSVTDARNLVNLSITQNADLARIFLVGSADRESLSPEDRLRFDVTCLSYLHVVETMYPQAGAGTGEQSLMKAEERSLRDLLSIPGIRAWWCENPFAFDPEFRAYIDGFLENEGKS